MCCHLLQSRGLCQDVVEKCLVGLKGQRHKVVYRKATVVLPEYFSAALSLLNLLENNLGRSKTATRLMQAQ
jgi:hypothetical protein